MRVAAGCVHEWKIRDTVRKDEVLEFQRQEKFVMCGGLTLA